MEEIIEFVWYRFGLIGLFLNFLGTLMVAVSFGKNPADANQKDDKGREIYLASLLRPKLFKWGLIIIIMGFSLQFIKLSVSP